MKRPTSGHIHVRLNDVIGDFTCLICGELIDPHRQPWTLLHYYLEDRGLPGVYKRCPPPTSKNQSPKSR